MEISHSKNPYKILSFSSTAPNSSMPSRNHLNFTLGISPSHQSLTANPARRDPLQVSSSLQDLKPRPKLLTLKDSKFSSISDYPSSEKPLFYSFKDPGRHPICDKNACFDRKYYELPENRLKLLVNQRILNMDQAALNHITYKLAQEQYEESEKAKKYSEFRKRVITAAATRKKNSEILQAKTGLIRYMPAHKQYACKSSERIGLLSLPKTIKKGYAEDYIDSYGLLKAGLLETGNSVLPKSARIPSSKIFSPFPLQIVKRNKQYSKTNCNSKEDVEENKIYSNDEIQECMKEITAFHIKFGELKGRVGFPKIYLDIDGHDEKS